MKSFLESRGIHIPFGAPSDPPFEETVCGLGNRKNGLFNIKVEELGVDVDEEAVRFVRELRGAGVKVGLASSSKNAVPILTRVGLSQQFEAVVDGLVSERLQLKGKPRPDIFLKCLEMLTGRVDAQRALVVEDAISGVQAGRAGNFGLVLGVDRHQQAEALKQHGADWVIRDFGEVNIDRVRDFFRARAVA